MSIYSTIGKWLVASAVVGAGATGTVIGISKVSGVKVDKTKNYSSIQDRRDFDSNLNSQQDSSSTPQTTHKEILLESEKDLGDQIKNSEDSDQSLEKNPKTQSEDLKTTDSREDSPTLKEEEVRVELPESSLERPSDKGDQAVTQEAITLPSVTVNHENQSNSVNWFTVKLVEDDIFDESEWPVRECFQDIKVDHALFRCNWNEDPSKPITFNLFLSSSPALKGKNWKDLVDLHLKPNGDDKADLGLIFADSNEREIEVSLTKKELDS